MTKKYEIEKVLHEIIRDLPEAATTAKAYKRGVITFDEALYDIARAYRKEMQSHE